MYLFRTGTRQRGGALCSATLSLLLLLGLPALTTATLADHAIVSTAGLVILVCLLPEPV